MLEELISELSKPKKHNSKFFGVQKQVTKVGGSSDIGPTYRIRLDGLKRA